MSKNAKVGKQQYIAGTEPKLDAVQSAALAYVEAERDANLAKQKAKRRKEDMVALAQKRGLCTIKFTDPDGWTHTFEIDAHVKHMAFQAVKIEKVGAGD